MESNLPEGWTEASLGEVVQIEMGQSPKGTATNTNSQGIPLIGGASDLGEEKPNTGRFTTAPTKVCELKDIILCVRATIGKLNVADRQYCLGRGVAGLRPVGFNLDWLKHWLVHNSVNLENKGTGTTFKQINKDTIANHPILFPPLPEQRHIADKIDALQAKSKKAREALEAARPLLDKLRQSVLASAFRGDLTADWRAKNPDVEPASALLEHIREERRRRWEKAELAKIRAKGKEPKNDKWKDRYKEPEPVDTTGLPELPEGWCWCALEQLGIHKSGIAYKSKEFTSAGIQVVKLGNLYQGRFDLSRDPSFLPEDHPDIGIGMVAPKDLLISQTGTRHKRDYGNFVVVPEGAPKLVLNQRLLAVHLVDDRLANWVLYASRLNYYREHFFSHETGGVNQGNVGVAGVMRGPLPLAPYEEMVKVMAKCEESDKAIDNIEAMTCEEAKNLAQLNQSILAKAFRGELVPQNPNDEPASLLLERIRTERETLKPKRKTTRKRKKTTA